MATRTNSVEPAIRAYQVVALAVGWVRTQVEAADFGPLAPVYLPRMVAEVSSGRLS